MRRPLRDIWFMPRIAKVTAFVLMTAAVPISESVRIRDYDTARERQERRSIMSRQENTWSRVRCIAWLLPLGLVLFAVLLPSATSITPSQPNTRSALFDYDGSKEPFPI